MIEHDISCDLDEDCLCPAGKLDGDNWGDCLAAAFGCGEISGSFTHTFDSPPDVLNHFFTLTVKRRVVWWKRPWFWLRRKPTSFSGTYTDVVFDEMHVTDDGGVAVRFETWEP